MYTAGIVFFLLVGSYFFLGVTTFNQKDSAPILNSISIQRIMIERYTRYIQLAIVGHVSQNRKLVLPNMKSANETAKFIDQNYLALLHGGRIIFSIDGLHSKSIKRLKYNNVLERLEKAQTEWLKLKKIAASAVQSDRQPAFSDQMISELDKQRIVTLSAQDEAVVTMQYVAEHNTEDLIRIEEIILILESCTFIMSLVYAFYYIARPMEYARKQLENHRQELQEKINKQTQDLINANEEIKKAYTESEMFAQIPKNNPNPIVELDDKGAIIRYNPALEKTFPEIALIGTDHPLLSGVRDLVIKDNVPYQRQLDMGKAFYLQTVIRVVLEGKGKYIIYSYDITAIKEAQKQAEQASRLKSEFLANISHELKTPMHSIINFSRAGVKRIEHWPKEEQVNNLNLIKESGNRLLNLLNDLLDLSKLESGAVEYAKEMYDIVQVTKSIIQHLGNAIQQKSLKVTIGTGMEPIYATFDKEKMIQVIDNLLTNGIKFVPEHRDIIIYIQETEWKKEPAVKYTIEDKGIGLPEDELKTIFNKFIQSSKTKTGAGGTGLGLAICKEIIEGHQGIIWAENNIYGGASFTFIFPSNV